MRIDSDEAFTKIETVKALGKINDPSSTNILKQALKDLDKAAVPMLQEALCVERYHLRAVLAIESIDKNKVIPLGAPLKHKSPEARREAITIYINPRASGLIILFADQL